MSLSLSLPLPLPACLPACLSLSLSLSVSLSVSLSLSLSLRAEGMIVIVNHHLHNYSLHSICFSIVYQIYQTRSITFINIIAIQAHLSFDPFLFYHSALFIIFLEQKQRRRLQSRKTGSDHMEGKGYTQKQKIHRNILRTEQTDGYTQKPQIHRNILRTKQTQGCTQKPEIRRNIFRTEQTEQRLRHDGQLSVCQMRSTISYFKNILSFFLFIESLFTLMK